jgi:hypothetical protein
MPRKHLIGDKGKCILVGATVTRKAGHPSGEGASPQPPQTRPLQEGEDFADINQLLMQLQALNANRPSSGNKGSSGNTDGGRK